MYLMSWCTRYYFEVVVQDSGLCRVGWATDKASLDLGTDANVSCSLACVGTG